jgi:hypothetical protein
MARASPLSILCALVVVLESCVRSHPSGDSGSVVTNASTQNVPAVIKISPTNSTFSLGFSVILNVDLLNVGSTPLWIPATFSFDGHPPPRGNGNVWATLTDESGERLQYRCTEGSGPPNLDHVILLPGGSHLGVIDLHWACFKFKNGGQYKIVVHFRDDDWKWSSTPPGVIHLTSEIESNATEFMIRTTRTDVDL